jgi:hypothetical protein
VIAKTLHPVERLKYIRRGSKESTTKQAIWWFNFIPINKAANLIAQSPRSIVKRRRCIVV